MKNSNLDRIEHFGRVHSSMSNEAPHSCIDFREGRQQSYLDMQIVKQWVLPLLVKYHRTKISILDVGAGTGRMTRNFSKIANHCVAIEPCPNLFNRLKVSCAETNVKFYQCPLQEYVQIAKESFDFIFISGVLMYHDDVEALQALLLSHKLLEP